MTINFTQLVRDQDAHEPGERYLSGLNSYPPREQQAREDLREFVLGWYMDGQFCPDDPHEWSVGR